MSLRLAAAFAAVTVLVAVSLGLLAGTIARPAPPTPRRVVITLPPAPTRTPAPTSEADLFRQQLSGGCATDQGVWVVTDGGGLLQYDGTSWSQADSTLRTLVFAACDESLMYAVGPAGAVLTVDDRARRIRAVDITTADLYGITPLPDGAIAVGGQGAVHRLVGGFWSVYARGIEEDLFAIAAFSGDSAWAVGSGGVSYRLEPAGWRPVTTNVDVALRSVAGASVASVVAVGDRGTMLAFADGRWSTVDSGVEEGLRSVARAGSLTWVVGQKGVVLVVDGIPAQGAPTSPLRVRRLDLRTACDLSRVFLRGEDTWIVGSDGQGGAVWRLRGDTVAQHWGAC
jgi:hypothetical protein